jgi:hypothetical protein
VLNRLDPPGHGKELDMGIKAGYVTPNGSIKIETDDERQFTLARGAELPGAPNVYRRAQDAIAVLEAIVTLGVDDDSRSRGRSTFDEHHV